MITGTLASMTAGSITATIQKNDIVATTPTQREMIGTATTKEIGGESVTRIAVKHVSQRRLKS